MGELIQNENKIWETDEIEGPDIPVKKAWEHKHDMLEILEFAYETVFKKEVQAQKRRKTFVEIAGGSGWASSALSHHLKKDKKWSDKDKFIFTDGSDFAVRKAKDMLQYVTAKTQFNQAQIDEFKVIDAHKLPFADNSTDIVFISAGLHHLENPGKFIKEASRILKNGGLFWAIGEPVMAPYLIPIYKRVSGSQKRAKEFGIKEGVFSYKELRRIFSEAGFKNHEIIANKNKKFRKKSLIRNAYYNVVEHLPDKVLMKYLMTSIFIRARK